jgi:hypothetical protein
LPNAPIEQADALATAMIYNERPFLKRLTDTFYPEHPLHAFEAR